jgi:hypothetical protein
MPNLEYVISGLYWVRHCEEWRSINANLKHLWISMGGKEDIAHENCRVMMKKFDEMGVKYQYSEYPGGIPGRCGDTICLPFRNCFSSKLPVYK